MSLYCFCGHQIINGTLLGHVRRVHKLMLNKDKK